LRLCRAIKRAAGRFMALFSKHRDIDIWLVYFMAIIDNLTLKETRDICERFVMRRGERMRLLSVKEAQKRMIKALESKKDMAPSAIYRMLEFVSDEAMLFIAAKSSSRLLQKRIESFLGAYNGVRTTVRGADLKALGALPGPGFTTLLKKVLYAKMDGKVSTRREELKYVRQLLCH